MLTVKQAMKVYGVDEARAEMIIAISKGEIGGDVIDENELMLREQYQYEKREGFNGEVSQKAIQLALNKLKGAKDHE